MAFDGFVTKAVINELNKVLIGAKVNRVLQPTKNEIVFETYNNGERYFLQISTVADLCRISLTKNLKPNPQNAYNFCMLLRKHLVGSRITEISNYDLERTAQIKFEGYNELNDLVKKRLYVEIMSRQSNIILTNENNIIIDSLRHFDGNLRELLPAHPFKFTPILKKSFIELENFDEFLELVYENGEEKISQKLPEIFIGFSKTLVLEAIKIVEIDDETYNEYDLERLYNYFKELIKKLDENKVPCVQTDKDFTLILKEKKEKLQINNFIDEYYFLKEQKNIFNNSKNNLLKIISASLKKVYKKLENINQKLKECEDMEKYKLYGELLTANLYNINSNQNLSEIEVFNYYENKNIIIKLDSKVNVSKNIEKFFKKYKKLKNTLSIVSDQKRQAVREIDYIESIIFSLDNSKTMQDIDEIYEEVSENFVTKKEINLKKQKNVKKKDREIKIEPINVMGFNVYIGKNNIQNEFLTLKFASKEDIWFHTQKIHGSHVILKTEGIEEVPNEVLYECAKLAMQNSKAKNSSNVPVDFCKVKFIKRSASGKTGMVNYTNYNTIFVK